MLISNLQSPISKKKIANMESWRQKNCHLQPSFPSQYPCQGNFGRQAYFYACPRLPVLWQSLTMVRIGLVAVGQCPLGNQARRCFIHFYYTGLDVVKSRFLPTLLARQ